MTPSPSRYDSRHIATGRCRPIREAAFARQGGAAVVNAYILIQTEVGKAAQVAKEVSGIRGVAMAEDVTGPYDVIVRAEAKNVDELGKLVVAKIQAVEGIGPASPSRLRPRLRSSWGRSTASSTSRSTSWA